VNAEHSKAASMLLLQLLRLFLRRLDLIGLMDAGRHDSPSYCTTAMQQQAHTNVTNPAVDQLTLLASLKQLSLFC